MEAGVADHVLSLEEIAALAEIENLNEESLSPPSLALRIASGHLILRNQR
jgi:hypothetical protein